MADVHNQITRSRIIYVIGKLVWCNLLLNEINGTFNFKSNEAISKVKFN